MKLILIQIIIFLQFAIGATISGDQGRVTITGGSMDVTSGGATVTVNSGEITFIEEGKAPTTPRKANQNDLKDINNALEGDNNNEQVMNLKYPALNPNLLRHLRLELIKTGIPRDSIVMAREGKDSILTLEEIKIDLIKDLYPAYYKVVEKYYAKKQSSGKVPSLTIKKAHVKKYHKELFLKYDR